jgi:excisionase family DNA binding protein
MPMSRLEPLEVVEPTAADVTVAKRSRTAIAEAAERMGARDEGMVRLEEVELPASVVRALSRILDEISEGHSVVIDTADLDDPELTTTQAARVLGVPRSTLIDLLKDGAIPFRTVGTHRRLALSDLLAYRESGGRIPREPSEAGMLRGLEEMAEYTNSLGLGY